MDLKRLIKRMFTSRMIQTTERATSGILLKLGWFDQLMAGVDCPKYFGSGVNTVGGADPPYFQYYT